jgi:Spy/CpxP family protein refolding chaperone
MIQAVQGQLQMVIDEKRRTIERMQDKHQDEIREVLKSQVKESRAYIEQISRSLYDKYKMEEEKVSLCSRIMRWFM